MMQSLPRSVGVYGGGRMGAGIAHAFLVSGVEVSLLEGDTGAAAAARHRVERSLAQAARRGVLGVDATEHLERLRVGEDVSQLVGVEVVVEAVPEAFALKSEVL